MQWLLILIPVFWFLAAKVIFHKSINWQEVIVSCLVSFGLVMGITAASKYGKTQDTEIWNGYVTQKKMLQQNCQKGWRSSRDSFCTEYKTREVYVGETCYTDSDGNQSCYPEYETEYKYLYPWERKWMVYTTLRTYEINRVDRQGAKEPKRWTIVKKNDPVSITKTYDNYVKAVPDSLFNNVTMNLEQFAAQIPSYPGIHDYYRVNRVIKVGYSDKSLGDLNYELGKALGRLNPRKQVNANIIITSIEDPAYKYAVEHKWLGGKKNDVTIFLGMEKGTQNIKWVDVMTFGMNDFNGIFVTSLTSSLRELGTISDTAAVVKVIETKINKHFDRPSMEDYQYLEEEIKPSKSAMIWAAILNLIASIGLSFLFTRIEFDPIGHILYELNLKSRRRNRW